MAQPKPQTTRGPALKRHAGPGSAEELMARLAGEVARSATRGVEQAALLEGVGEQAFAAIAAVARETSAGELAQCAQAIRAQVGYGFGVLAELEHVALRPTVLSSSAVAAWPRRSARRRNAIRHSPPGRDFAAPTGDSVSQAGWHPDCHVLSVRTTSEKPEDATTTEPALPARVEVKLTA